MLQDSPHELSELDDAGFVIVPGPFSKAEFPAIVAAYDSFVPRPGGKLGSTSFRSASLKDAGQPFDRLLSYEPIKQAAQQIIGPLFRLSAFHGRSLLPNVAGPPLHQDFAPTGEGWPMVGFILMIDAFRPENGATRFLAGSQHIASLEAEPPADDPRLRQACGEAGSLILYNGSTWHEHGTNLTGEPRRSVQGAFVRF